MIVIQKNVSLDQINFARSKIGFTEDGSDSARNSTHCGTCVRYPTLGREVGNNDGRGGLGGAGNGFGHGGR